MAVVVREFEQMVADTLARIVNSTAITNTNSGSVIRTLVESILSETDVQYYQLTQLFNAMGLDTATSTDLDRLVSILGVTRKPASAAIYNNQVFGRADPATTDISIPQGTIISTLPDRDGKLVEFYVSETDAILRVGQTSIEVQVTCSTVGSIYIPQGALNIMNNPIVNIAYTVNESDIYGGTNAETDSELRERARSALTLLGRGTLSAIQTAVRQIVGVNDAIAIDMPDGPGTVDVIAVTATIPPDDILVDEIESVIAETKSAGIKVGIVYPTILEIDVSVTTTKFTDNVKIHRAIFDYVSNLKIADTFVISQMERAVLNVAAEAGYSTADIITLLPTSNITPSGTQIIRAGTITINGEVML